MVSKHNFDLEERSFQFAKRIRLTFKSISVLPSERNDWNQLLRSSSSIAANYLEANDSLGKKDLIFRLKIARKEAKESVLFLRLIKETHTSIDDKLEIDQLLDEAIQLKKILSSIIIKIERRNKNFDS